MIRLILIMDPFIADFNARKYQPLREGEITNEKKVENFYQSTTKRRKQTNHHQIQKEMRTKCTKAMPVRKLLTRFSLFWIQLHCNLLFEFSKSWYLRTHKRVLRRARVCVDGWLSVFFIQFSRQFKCLMHGQFYHFVLSSFWLLFFCVVFRRTHRCVKKVLR